MDEDRLVISDELRAKIAPLLPGKAGDPGATGRDNRRFMEAVPWRVRTGSPRRDLPQDFGNWISATGFRQLEFGFQTISSMGKGRCV